MTNITSSKTVQFNEIPIEIINIDNQEYITSTSLSQALGYESPDSVTKIYIRNSDEFAKGMSKTVNLTISVNLSKKHQL